jgi:hypothetical protein
MVNRPGIGAVCSAPLKYMHPSAVITGKFPTMAVKQRLSGLLAIRKEQRKLNCKEKDSTCIIFRHDDFPNIELYCHHRWCHVEEEGPEVNLFDAVATGETREEQEEPQ